MRNLDDSLSSTYNVLHNLEDKLDVILRLEKLDPGKAINVTLTCLFRHN